MTKILAINKNKNKAGLNLYQPEKYKIFKGSGQVIGLCTIWNEPEAAFKKSKILRNKVSILGTLYSRQGVNIIIRNLALNPQIRKVFIWGNGSLSNTEFGIVGKGLLEKLWQNGIDKNGTIKGTTFKVEKEINRQILQKIILNVELVDVSHLNLKQVEKLIGESDVSSLPYMDPAEFIESTQEEAATFPSEVVGWLVRDKSILGAWSRVVDRIMRYGIIKGTQYGYQQRELIGVTWVIHNEDPDKPDLTLTRDWPQELRQVTGANEKSIKEYYRVFLSSDLPSGTFYTYGNRLMRYPINKSLKKINQIEEVIIKQLRDSPDSRRAVATTMVPLVDKDSSESPCITQVQALQSGGLLHLLVVVRSHDIFKGAIPNAFGLRILQKKICRRLGFELGYLQITSQSAHIYEQDWDNALKLSRCFFWEKKPNLKFDASTKADPRGNILIAIKNEKIIATLQNPQSGDLLSIEGKTAKEISAKIIQLEILSRSDHLMDIAMELQKAEMALKLRLPYKQDSIFNLKND